MVEVQNGAGVREIVGPSMKKIMFLLTALVIGAALSAQQRIEMSIRDTAGPQISRYINGQFAGHLGRCVYDGLFRDGKVRADVVE